MSYKSNYMYRPIIGLTKDLLLCWHNSHNGKDVKYYTNIYVSNISRIGGAVSIIKDALKCFENPKNKQ